MGPHVSNSTHSHNLFRFVRCYDPDMGLSVSCHFLRAKVTKWCVTDELDNRSTNFSPIQVIEDCKDSVMSVHVKGVEIVAGYVRIVISSSVANFFLRRCADGRLRTYDLRMGQLLEDYIGRKREFLWCKLLHSLNNLCVFQRQLHLLHCHTMETVS